MFGQIVPTIETERLKLRRWSKKDADDFFAYAKNPNVGPWAGWKPHENRNVSRNIIAASFTKGLIWAIEEKASGRVIGSIELCEDKLRADINSKELGYSLSEDYWGRGIMPEAAREVIRYAFEVLCVDVLTITTGEANVRSRRVIEKCGFKYEGTLRRIYKIYDGTIRDLMCYSMLREEYHELREAGVGLWEPRESGSGKPMSRDDFRAR